MKIAYVSDLHLDFDIPPIKQMKADADYLFIAGDTLEAKWFGFAQNPNSGNFGQAQVYVEFFKAVAEHYKEVYIILGNHEHYYSVLDETLEIIQDFFKLYKIHNVRVLENESFTLENKVVYAGTGWTDMGGPHNYWDVKQAMNDFRLIRKSGYSRFKPEDAVKIHTHFLAALREKQPDIILMHHAPAHKSIAPQYAGDPVNGAYYSKAMEVMLNSWNKPLLIVHGHTHYPVDYSLGANIRVVSNPKGYTGSLGFKVEVIDV